MERMGVAPQRFAQAGLAADQPNRFARRGYNLAHSNHAGMSYWIASDLEAPELGRLEKLIAGIHAM